MREETNTKHTNMCEQNNNGVTWFVNLENTTSNNMGDNWLDYYIKNVSYEQQALFEINNNICPVCHENEMEVGAHIGIISPDDRHAYILPLCRSCNQKTSRLPLPDVEVVPVPTDSDGFSKIRYPEFAVTMIKSLAHGKLDNWNGAPQKD
ncbi:MAG: hypothetical protein Q3986_03610 [Akkermansia sp.]|nr:hypothetical protein [Akkermansia sp.]